MTSAKKRDLETVLTNTAVKQFLTRAVDLLATLGEEAFELLAAVLIMIMIERTHGQSGLGIYAYLAACYYVARYAAAFGVPCWAEREVAVSEHTDNRLRAVSADGHRTLVVTGLAAFLVLVASAGFDTSHTSIEERLGGYVILAVLVPLANFNRLKLAILRGRGEHVRVSRQRAVAQVVLITAVFFLSRSGLPPSYLMIVYLPAELMLALELRKHLRSPGGWRIFRHRVAIRETLGKGYDYLFTDNALDILINIDLFVLGMFVDAWHLGVYAEVAVLVRIFLLVPVALTPLLRKHYGTLLGDPAHHRMVIFFKRSAVTLFWTATVAGLYFVLGYPWVLDFFFELRGEQRVSFELFTLIVPGVVFYGFVSAQEPLYEILGHARALKRLTIRVALFNLMATLYMVPQAGGKGAAIATMLSMLAYFVLFGRDLPTGFRLPRYDFMVAGLSAYLVWRGLQQLDWPMFVLLAVVPLSMAVLFYLIGLNGNPVHTPGNSSRLS